MRPAPFPRFLVVLAVLLASACAAAGRGEVPERLRVLVYNVHAGKDAAGARNLDEVAEVVLRSGADVVLLQEVDRGTQRSGGEDQLASLRRLTGFHGAFGRTLHFQGGEFGIAVLSRWPLSGDSLHPLPVRPVPERSGAYYEERGALLAAVRAPAGTLHLLNTHLDAAASDAYRVQQVERVVALADSLRRAGGLVLVGGDLNDIPGSRAVGALASAGWSDAWTGCGDGEGHTFPAHEPTKRIDYLFLPPGVRCDSAAVLPSLASDHRPVLLILNLERR